VFVLIKVYQAPEIPEEYKWRKPIVYIVESCTKEWDDEVFACELARRLSFYSANDSLDYERYDKRPIFVVYDVKG